MRVYEIAKEVGIPNKDLITKIRALGLEVNNHMSSLDADDVARIKRSLEKEKQTVAQPQQTQRLSSGTVLRRRSSGDKASDGGDEPVKESASAPVIARSRDNGSATAVAPAPAPVVRRRVAEAAPVAPPPVEREPAPVAPPVVARARKSEPVIETRVEAEAPKPRTPTPTNEVAPAPRHVEPTPAPEPPRHVEAEAVRAPEPVAAAPEHVEARPARTRAPDPEARDHTPPATHAADAEPAPVPARSRVIVAGPQHVGKTASSESSSRTHEPTPPPSTPLPPRVAPSRTSPPPVAAQAAPADGVDAIPESARSRFELELERARARTSERPTTRSVELEVRSDGSLQQVGIEPELSGPPSRDPARPAVGTVISLPPRIKITERASATGRPAPAGPQPANPIRGRFAQQQQHRGRPGGPNDMRKKLPLGKKGKQTTDSPRPPSTSASSGSKTRS